MVRAVYEAEATQLLASNETTASANPTANTTTTTSTNSSSSSSSNNATDLLCRALPLLLREHEYWTTGPKAVVVRAADGSNHSLSRWVWGFVCAFWGGDVWKGMSVWVYVGVGAHWCTEQAGGQMTRSAASLLL